MVLISPPSTSPPSLQAFRTVPRTGVVYVTKEATLRGYRPGDSGWSNLGQGQPETGSLPGAPPRIQDVVIDPADHYYAPVAGIPSCGRPWPRSTTACTAAACGRSTPRRTWPSPAAAGRP